MHDLHELDDQLPFDLRDTLLAAELRYAELPVLRASRRADLLSALVFDGGKLARFERGARQWVLSLSLPLPPSVHLSLEDQGIVAIRASVLARTPKPNASDKIYLIKSAAGLRSVASILRNVFGAEQELVVGIEFKELDDLSVCRPPYYASRPAKAFWIESLTSIAKFADVFQDSYDSTATFERAYAEAQKFYGVDHVRTNALRTALLAHYESKAIKLADDALIYPQKASELIAEMGQIQSRRDALSRVAKSEEEGCS